MSNRPSFAAYLRRVRVRSALTTLALTGLCLCGALAGVPAQAAEVGASGTRLQLPGGAARFYMTYGHVEEPELYAPILEELRRLGVVFRQKGNSYEVFYKGAKLKMDPWPIVRRRQDIPETGEEAVVLVMGGNIFVPVRKIAERFNLEVKWNQGDNMVALVPRPRPKSPVVRRTTPAPVSATLNAVELRREGDRVEVVVRGNVPVKPELLVVTVKPVRLVMDFPNARWAPDVAVPEPIGDIRTVRTGIFEGRAARLVLEVPSAQVKFNSVRVVPEGVKAVVGDGAGVRVATVTPEAQAVLQRLQGTQVAVNNLPDRDNFDLLLPVVPAVPVYEQAVPFQGVAATSLVGKTIVIDAGHGGEDTGARGRHNHEKELCLKICQTLRRNLQAQGARVVMTRDNDVYVSLAGRCAIANAANADLFISVHLNSTQGFDRATGTETYWYTPHSHQLARSLHRRVVQAVGGPDRGIRNRGFYVIRNTNMPSVLLEIGFINHRSDEALLAQESFHERLSESLTKGVLEYFGKDGRVSQK